VAEPNTDSYKTFMDKKNLQLVFSGQRNKNLKAQQLIKVVGIQACTGVLL